MSALSFAPQIMAAHNEAVAAAKAGYTSSLEHAIKAGDLLNRAKETVKAERGKWLDWLKENCADIPQTTASLYMRLAAPDNQKHLAAKKTNNAVANLADEGKLSIRGAAALLPKQSRKPKTPKPPAMRAPQPELFDTELKNLAPDELFSKLIFAWDGDQLNELSDKLVKHLDEATASSITRELPIEPEPAAAAV